MSKWKDRSIEELQFANNICIQAMLKIAKANERGIINLTNDEFLALSELLLYRYGYTSRREKRERRRKKYEE